jgi:hypothetical protein
VTRICPRSGHMARLMNSLRRRNAAHFGSHGAHAPVRGVAQPLASGFRSTASGSGGSRRHAQLEFELVCGEFNRDRSGQ